jgi:hypothetical protein
VGAVVFAWWATHRAGIVARNAEARSTTATGEVATRFRNQNRFWRRALRHEKIRVHDAACALLASGKQNFCDFFKKIAQK